MIFTYCFNNWIISNYYITLCKTYYTCRGYIPACHHPLVNTMRRIHTTISIAAVLFMLVLLVLPVQAVPGNRTSTADGILRGMIPAGALDRLEEQGYDMTAVRAAVERGDTDAARTLLEQFMAEHRDEFPPPPGEEARLSARLDALEAEGIDVSAPRAALESGDLNTVLTLLRQLLDKNREILPQIPREARFLAQLDRLEEQGYDMTSIRAAVENGDMDTARTLLQQFIAEHKDELPAPPTGEDRFSSRGDHTGASCDTAGAGRGIFGSGTIDANRTMQRPVSQGPGTGYTRIPAPGSKPGRGAPDQSTE